DGVAVFRPPAFGMAKGALARRGHPTPLVFAFGNRLGTNGAQRLVELRQTLAMFGTDRNRIAETEPIGIKCASLAGAAFAFIGDENDALASLANHVRERTICSGGAGSRVNQKQNGIGLGDRRRCVRLHRSGEALAPGVFQAGGTDHLEGEIAELCVAFTPIPRHSRPIVDEREPAANEPVEQRRFANVRPADDRNGKGHGRGLRATIEKDGDGPLERANASGISLYTTLKRWSATTA